MVTASSSGAALPSYSDADLARLGPGALIDLLVADEDRVPRNVIDAAARLGDPIVLALQERLAVPRDDDESDGEWWLKLHAAMILGLMPQENAGLLLVELMRCLSAAGDDAMQDWLDSAWPALFANKPGSVLAPVRDLCADRDLDGYLRASALEVVLACAQHEGPAALDAALDWTAQMAADEQESLDMRLCCADALLDFPRERHRRLVDALAERQDSVELVHFHATDVSQAYEAGRDEPRWRGHEDPWNFYAPESIGERLARWASEGSDDSDDMNDESVADDDFAEPSLPYVRDVPKIGRNDPCPCGSGKKYKKCCMPA